MKKIIPTFAMLCACAFPAYAMAGPSRSYDALTQLDFDDFEKVLVQDYNTFAMENMRSYEQFRDAIEAKWATFKDSTPKEWVSYNQDLSTRSSVDFENGYAVVEVLIDSASPDAKKQAQESLQRQLLFIDRSCEKEAGFSLRHNGGFELDISVVPNRVQNQRPAHRPHYKPVPRPTQTPTHTITPKPAGQQHVIIDQKPSQNAKEKPQQTIVAKVPLPSDHLKKSAQKYKKLVHSNAAQYNIKTDIVYAIIHTESAFNPFARSPIPAFGLMQLVPNSGGADAYEYVYKKKGKPTEDFLYNPENNILFGTAYFCRIKNSYFKGVTNEETAYMMSIAAYNTGIGNVALALTGSRSLKNVARVANNMTPSQVRQTLLAKLPYQETKDYLKRVLDRSPMYIGL